MSKFGRYDEYPKRGLAQAQSALLTVWPSLSRYHSELVLVGGLAIHSLTKPHAGGYPSAVTIDADLGIALGAGGGMYGTISTDLAGLGFTKDPEQTNRFVREIEGTRIYLDFLTEAPGASTGTQMVDDVVASVVPGINRALDSAQEVTISGRDLYGTDKDMAVRVCGIGPLLTLKINAFGGPHGRRHPKDAYDLLLGVTAYREEASAAVEAFLAEAGEENPAYASAIEALKRDFSDAAADGPVRASEFLRGTLDEEERIRQDVVTVAKALLGD